jgi:hypothetical protein
MSLLIAVTEQLPGECLAETRTQASSVCGGEVDSACSPELLLYASTEELQTLATLKLQVALLHQQIHLEKVGFLGASDLTEAGTDSHPTPTPG